MTLAEARENIGRRVVYTRKCGECTANVEESGTIESIGRLYVYVLFDGDRHGCAKSCRAQDLYLEPPAIVVGETR